MSTNSIPQTLQPKDSMLNETGTHGKSEMPAEIAGTVNLMAHPLAGVAAISAIGLGFASQAMGAWFGALSGAAVASHRLFSPMFDEYEVDAFRELRAPNARAESSIAKLTLDADATVVQLRPHASAPAQATSKGAEKAALAPRANVETKPQSPAKNRAGTAKRSPVKAKSELQAPIALKASGKNSATGMAAMTPTQKLKPAAMTKPEQPDDLKAIAGLGPKVEQVLNGLGVWTFSQVAAWSDAEIAWVDDMLGFNGRIQRDDWLGQAKTLAAAKD